MVQLQVIRKALPSLIRSKTFVAVFVGGTSGIGEFTLQQLAKLHGSKGNLRAYIVGRNQNAAERIISECMRNCPDGHFIFVKAEDLSLLRDVDRVCAQIRWLEEQRLGDGNLPWVDLLVMSQACSVFQKRTETSEGIDFLMSLLYYSRMRCLVNFLPLLLRSEPSASVISVYAAGWEGKLILDDLPLKKAEHYGYLQARSHIVFLTTIFMERIAKENPGKLSLIHNFPGLIITPAFKDPALPLWFKVATPLFKPLLKWYILSPDEIGDRVLYLSTSSFPPMSMSDPDKPSDKAGSQSMTVATNGIVGGGAYSINDKSEPIPPNKAYKKIDKAELSEVGWAHTMQVFGQIESNGRFTGA